jgi:hypothetical protein
MDMGMLPLLALIGGCSWLLWQCYSSGIADWHALRTIRRKTHLLAEIAPAELQPTYTDIARRIQRVVRFVPTTQRHEVRLVLEHVYQDLFSVLLADTTPDPMTEYTRNRLAGIDRRLRDTERHIVLSNEF